MGGIKPTRLDNSYSEYLYQITNLANTPLINKSKRFFDKMITFSEQFLHEYYFKKNVKFLFDLSAKNDETLQSLEKCAMRMEDSQTLPILKQAISEDLLTVCVGTMELINIFTHLSNIISHQWKQKGLFNEVSGLIKNYLKSKTDLMSCLVRKVSTDQDLLDLSESANDEKEAKEMQEEIDIEDRDLKDNSKFTHNILSSILQVYATPLEFIEEYCSQMTIRLLKLNSAESLKYENDQIELLKRYFGPAVTQKCAIMMDDLKKSAQINNYIYNKSTIFSNSPIEFEVQLLTSLIWDVVQEGHEDGDPCRVPHNITRYRNSVGKNRLMEHYIEEYSNLKKLRELHWLNQYSMAEVEITFKNTTHNVWLSATHAIILHQLSNNNALTVEQLSEILSSSYDKIKSGLTALMKEGLISTQNGHEYKLVDEYEHEKATSKMNNDEIYDDDLNKQNDNKARDGMETVLIYN
ncbi:hypothetical protein MXB_3700 [Myxobolus squamalis]|nr:hypothetical protein MXB_3700 [Myxobolus squamalis]